MKKIAMNSLNTLFKAIAETQKLYLPIEKGGQVDFYEWNENEKVRLDVLKTVRSAKDVFFPQVEDLIKFRVEGKAISISECPKNEDDFVVFGVRGCDAKSFEILDRVFLVDPRDEFYAARRAHSTVVTLACGEPDSSCFCTNFGVNPRQARRRRHRLDRRRYPLHRGQHRKGREADRLPRGRRYRAR